jgi:hypothetical protein
VIGKPARNSPWIFTLADFFGRVCRGNNCLESVHAWGLITHDGSCLHGEPPADHDDVSLSPSIAMQRDDVSENPNREDCEQQSAWDIHPHVARYVYPVNIDSCDQKADANGEFDKHSDSQKYPTVHRSMFSGHK